MQLAILIGITAYFVWLSYPSNKESLKNDFFKILKILKKK